MQAGTNDAVTDVAGTEAAPPTGTPRWQFAVLAGLVVVLAVTVGVGLLVSRGTEDPRVAAFREAGGPPPLAGETLDGETADLADLRGRPVLVVFWAHWCPHCRVEMPVLADLESSGDLEMLTVTTEIAPGMGPDGYRSPQDFVDTVGLEAPAIVDGTGELSAAWRVEGYPTMFLVDSEGAVQEVKTGEVPGDDVREAFSGLE